MIELATALPAIAVGSPKPSLAISAGASGFALALGALLPGGGAPAPALAAAPREADPALPGRQPVAAGGKDLPDAVPGLDSAPEREAETDEADEQAPDQDPAPPFAWFAVAAPITPQPEAAPAARAPSPAAPVAPETQSPVQPAPAVTVAAEGAAATSVKSREPAPVAPETVVTEPVPVPVSAPVPSPKAAVQPQARDTDAPALRTAAAPAAPAAPAPAPAALQPTPSSANVPAAAAPTVVPPIVADRPPAPSDAAPSAELPAPPREFRRPDAPVVRIEAPQPAPAPTAREAAAGPPAEPLVLLREPPAARRPAPHEPQPGEVGPVAAAATGAQSAPAVAATGHDQQPALDTRRQEWTGRMIERIEALRDAAPVRETRISLMPEALGKLDVSIRQDGDGVHVHFNAETQAARQLIADAQPRLAEIAEQRGLRLGSTSIESGNAGSAGAGSGQRQDAAPRQSQQPSAPASARTGSPAAETDERIA